MSAVRTLDDILAPVTTERFLAEFHGRRVLHVRGDADKFAGLMSWQKLNELLAMRVWTATSLKLVLDKRTLPPEAYCRQVVNRNKLSVLEPDPERVLAWGRKGASLVLNEVESLDCGMTEACAALEQTLGAHGMINLYCSWRGHQAFDAHFDKHDVFAFHIAGEKRWRIYENRVENPIEHAAFKNIPQALLDANKGKVAQEIVLRPGDLLYVPRGTYHDALAESEACIHLSCGMSEPLGLNWLTTLWELAVEDPLFRAYLPRLDGPDGERRLTEHVETLLGRLTDLARSSQAIDRTRALRRRSKPPPRFDLPQADAAGERFRVIAGGMRVVRHGPDWILKHGGISRPLPEAEAKAVSWMLDRKVFSRREFETAFADRPAEARDNLLKALTEEGRLATA